jgi:hypothetical protein
VKKNQLNRGQRRRLLYFENKNGLIDGVSARIGWATFLKSGRTVYYRGRTFKPSGNTGFSGNYRDEATGEEYWISGVKKRSSNAHPAERAVAPVIDEDAMEDFGQWVNG